MRDLALVIEGLGIDEVLTPVPPEHRCSVDGSRVIDYPEDRTSGGVQVVCGYGERAFSADVAWTNGSMKLPDKPAGTAQPRELPKIPDIEVIASEDLDDPATDPECKAAPPERPVPVKISVQYMKENPDPRAQGSTVEVISVSIPELGISESIETHQRRLCAGDLEADRQGYTLECTMGLHRESLRFKRKGDKVEIHHEKFQDDHGRSRLIGVQHICKKTLKFKPFSNYDKRERHGSD